MQWQYLTATVTLDDNLDVVEALIRESSSDGKPDATEVEELQAPKHFSDFLTDLGKQGWGLTAHSSLRTGKQNAILVFKKQIPLKLSSDVNNLLSLPREVMDDLFNSIISDAMQINIVEENR